LRIVSKRGGECNAECTMAMPVVFSL